MEETERLITTLRERARRHGLSLEQELSAILAAAGAGQARAALPPIRLTTVRGTATSPWSRDEIYGDEGRSPDHTPGPGDDRYERAAGSSTASR
jgi:hypothetical protein